MTKEQEKRLGLPGLPDKITVRNILRSRAITGIHCTTLLGMQDDDRAVLLEREKERREMLGGVDKYVLYIVNS